MGLCAKIYGVLKEVRNFYNAKESIMLKTEKSRQIYQSLCEIIPGGVNSPVRSFKGMGIPPMIVDKGYEDCIEDVDGNTFIDYCCSWGPLIHGHSHEKIIEGVKKGLAKGTTFGITTAVEEKLARKIVNHVKSVEKIRFVSSGTEATMSAIRVARGFTQRDLIVKFTGNYHGHADFLLVNAGSGVIGITPTSSSAGIPEQIIQHTICFPYNNVEVCKAFLQDPKYLNQIAAVIVEPVAANMGVVPATPAFIHMLRKETEKQGIVLIFDEVISGFRLGLEGAQGVYGVKPDLTCFGKIIGGGFPAAAFGGRREIMDMLAPLGPVYQAGTLSGNPIAMEAGLQAIELLEQEGFYQELERKTNLITQPVAEFIRSKGLNACLQQAGSLFTLFFGLEKVESMEDGEKLDLEKFAEFFRYMYHHGVYISPSQYEACFVSMAHKEENLIKTRDLILTFLK
jgi:glutamate-1-semialdehyde 2,1-aminomutase